MSLLDFYIERNRAQAWQEKLNGKNDKNGLFEFTADFSVINNFEEGFKLFRKVCEMSPEDRAVFFERHNVLSKSYLGNIMSTKLFMTQRGERTLSAKGEVYQKFLQEKMAPDDKWFVNLLFILDSYFCLKSNYLFGAVDKIFNDWFKAGYTISQIYNALIYLFNIKEGNVGEYLRSEYIVMLCCRHDVGFLTAYRESSEFEKSEMHDYIENNFENERYACLISFMFRKKGGMDFTSMLDTAKVLFFSHYIFNSHPISLEDMLEIYGQVYGKFFKLNTKKVLNFIMMYEDVFRMTYLNLFSDMQDFYLNLRLDDKILANTFEDLDEAGLDELLKNNVDYTTTQSINALVKINSMLSAKAKAETEYSCELDAENHCKYFTCKESGLPYLEIHQLIPRNYANEFNTTVEKLSNYIPLCPSCHRLIHNATDAERFKLLSMIFRKRRDRLIRDGIEPSSKLLFSIYGIEQDKLPSKDSDFSKPLLDEPQPKLAAGKPQAKSKKTSKSAK